MLKFKIS